MATASLTNTNISDTYTSVLHVNGEPLPATGLQSVYDGYGNKSSLEIGRAKQGITVTGKIITDNDIVLNTAPVNSNILSLSASSYPKLMFGFSDNTDVMYITRANVGADSSQIRVVIGDNVRGGSDQFVIGGFDYRTTEDFIPLTTVDSTGNMNVQLATHATKYTKPSGWGGGVTSFDFYSDGGSIGTGKAGSLAAYMNKDGAIVGKNITAETITSTNTTNGITAPNTAKAFGYAKTNNFTAASQTFSTATGFNFASVTWRSRGCYRVTFTTPMANDQYAVVLQNANMRNSNDPHSGTNNDGDENPLLVKIKTTSYFEFICWSHESNKIENLTGFCFVVFGG
jgi:hypothetical protein